MSENITLSLELHFVYSYEQKTLASIADETSKCLLTKTVDKIVKFVVF